ncbi:protein Mis18-beta isoform X2 [Ambystoma mexicanum]|uniref:protein Mis18-beta isoform X2 n=1 Tax=Ambystoma mexicanum TaxID=8296 RepID=UPI0037E786F2
MSRFSRRIQTRTRTNGTSSAAEQPQTPPQLKEPVATSGEPEPAASLPVLCGRYNLKDMLVFQCSQCNTVLGDSLQMCGEDANLDCVICLRVTSDVIIEENLMFDVEGLLAGSSYNPLYCRSCRILIGFCLYSTLKSLAHLRRLFCLSKEKFSCYLLESKKSVPASDLNFNISSLKDTFSEMKHGLVEAYCGIQLLTSRLEGLAVEKAANEPSTVEQGGVSPS